MQNFHEIMEKESERISSLEQVLGKGLYQPFSISNSGSRKVLFSTQLDHSIPLLNPEIPIISTGYENKYGDYSASIIKMDDDYEVIKKISKFSRIPNHQYLLIIKNKNTGQLDVLERIMYKNKTESYGYLYDTKIMDELDEGYTIRKGETVRSSKAYDGYMNRCDGVNLKVSYICQDKTMEDGIRVSQSAAIKLSSPFIKKIPPVFLNDNDIPLNLYGDSDTYKCFPDIGEKVNGGLVFATRRENQDDILYTQSIEMLKQVLMSDSKYIVSGDSEIIDIDIQTNNPDMLGKFQNSQLNYYYEEKQRYLFEIITTVESLAAKGDNYISYELEKLYVEAKRQFQNTEYLYDKTFSGTMLEITILERNIPSVGDKLSNRYGGKGVISEIVPDNLMPIDKDTGKAVDISFNSSTCVNRLNDGQLKEQSLTHIGSRIIQYIVQSGMVQNTDAALAHIVKFVLLCSPLYGRVLDSMILEMSDEDRDIYLQNIIDSGYIALCIKPASENLTLDQLDKIYKEFSYVKQREMMVPIKDSNGNIRYVPSRRRIVVGDMYIYRLKQYAEEKFSVTSLSSVNIRNENTRSKLSKNYKSLHSNTPIKFGDMESNDLGHAGIENVLAILMIHSVSPQARRLVYEMLTDDPYNIDIRLSDNAVNRTAQIANIYLKTMGYRLKFIKIKKKILHGLYKKGMVYHWGDKELPHGMTYISDEEEYDFDKNYQRMLEAEEEFAKRGMVYEGMYYKP